MGGSLIASVLSGALSAAGHAELGRAVPPSHPRRIVALGLHNDELALALAPDRVVAVDAFADDDAVSFAAGPAREVEHRVRATVESILGTEPDLVLLPGWVPAELEQAIARANVAVVRVPVPTSLEEIRACIREVAALLDAEEAAARLDAELERVLIEVAALPPIAPRPRALLLAATGTSPGRGTLFAELLERAGGEIALDQEGIVPLAHERLLAADPDVIFLDGYRADGRGRTLGRDLDEVLARNLRPHLSAARAGHVYPLSPRLTNTTTHHIGNTLTALAQALRDLPASE